MDSSEISWDVLCVRLAVGQMEDGDEHLCLSSLQASLWGSPAMPHSWPCPVSSAVSQSHDHTRLLSCVPAHSHTKCAVETDDHECTVQPHRHAC